MLKPANRNVHIHQDFKRLTIEIPAKKNKAAILFMIIWMGGWLMGELFAINSFMDEDTFIVARIFLAIWLLAWTVGGAFVVYTILWQLFGKETFTLERGNVEIEKKVLGIGLQKSYEVRKMKNIRLNPKITQGPEQDEKGGTNFGGRKGKLLFDYDSKTIHFGGGINKNDAEGILEKLKSSGKFSRENFGGEW